MIELITPIDFDNSLREWRDHYRRKSFALARSTMMDASEYYPRRPETWFLLGLTELAARDVYNAEDHFNHLAALLESGEFERAEFFIRNEQAIRALTPWILRGLESYTLYAAPYDPWMWINNWEEVVKVEPTLDSALAYQPLGRKEPLLSDEARAKEMRQLPRLMDQLRVEPVKVDTMKDLLGRDANISIDLHRIRIIDDSVAIEKPLLKAADGTYKPLLTVNVQRPRWDVVHTPPPRTVSDLAARVEIPPLPKMDPFDILPTVMLPPVVFEKPVFPAMEALSATSLPGATPVDMTPFVIERPQIPPAPEIQGLGRELAKQPRPAPLEKPTPTPPPHRRHPSRNPSPRWNAPPAGPP